MYDFNKFLRRYVHIIDVRNYSEDKDGLFIEKIEKILEEFFGERVVDLTVLNVTGTSEYSSVYAVFDNKEHPFDDVFIMGTVQKILVAMGVK